MNPHVLLVAEDNEMDALLLERAVGKAGMPFQMLRVEDGNALIAYLRGDGVYADRKQYPWPKVVLIDLKMPNVDGFGVLTWLRSNVDLPRIPAVVFSSSALTRDVERAYTLGANSYVVKPTAPENLESMVKALHKWWCEYNVTDPLAMT